MVVDFGNSRTGVLLLETGRRNQPDAADAALRAGQPLPSRRLERRGRVRQPAGGAVVLVEDPLVQHALPAAACSRRRSTTTPSARTTPSAAGSAAAGKTEAGQGRGGRHAAAVRRPLDGPHGPRGRRRGAGDAGRRRHPHRRQFAQALPLGRRRQLAGRGQLAHGRSGRPLRARAPTPRRCKGPFLQVHPRGRPRFPARGRRAARRASSPPRRR